MFKKLFQKNKKETTKKDSEELLLAAYGGDVKKVKKLIKRGVDIESRDRNGRTAVHNAISQFDKKDDWKDTLDFLIKSGANVNTKDNKEFTPLHFAVQDNSLEKAKVLIKAGADVNAKDSYGNNIVWRATFSYKGNNNLLDLLIKTGANPKVKNNHGVSAVDLTKTSPQLKNAAKSFKK